MIIMKQKKLLFPGLIVLLILVVFLLSRKDKESHVDGRISSDETIKLDLDGDGKKEKLLYSKGKLYINDKEYTDHLRQLGSMLEPVDEFISILDIDSNDKYVELAISTYGRSDDMESLFFYYDKGSLNYMGSIQGFPFEENVRSIKKLEDNLLLAPYRLSILQTWWGDAYYQVDDNRQLIIKGQDYYDVDEFYTASLLQPINLYQEPDKNSVASQIDVGSDLTFIKTDNINWCQVRLEDGTEGWIFIDGNYIEDGTTLTEDVFQGLYLYD